MRIIQYIVILLLLLTLSYGLDFSSYAMYFGKSLKQEVQCMVENHIEQYQNKIRNIPFNELLSKDNQRIQDSLISILKDKNFQDLLIDAILDYNLAYKLGYNLSKKMVTTEITKIENTDNLSFATKKLIDYSVHKIVSNFLQEESNLYDKTLLQNQVDKYIRKTLDILLY